MACVEEIVHSVPIFPLLCCLWKVIPSVTSHLASRDGRQMPSDIACLCWTFVTVVLGDGGGVEANKNKNKSSKTAFKNDSADYITKQGKNEGY